MGDFCIFVLPQTISYKSHMGSVSLSVSEPSLLLGVMMQS